MGNIRKFSESALIQVQYLISSYSYFSGCDHCEEWYHGDCINVNERDAKYIKKYFCKICIDKNPKLEIIYKSKYKEKEGHGSIGSGHSKNKVKELNRSSHEKHKDKYNQDGGHSKSKSGDRDKYREKDRDRSKYKDRKHRAERLADKEHRRKHDHGNHRKHHYRDKEQEEKLRREREKNFRSDKYQRNSEREKRKERDRELKDSDNESKKAADIRTHEINETKNSSFKEGTNNSVVKKEDEPSMKVEASEISPIGKDTTAKGGAAINDISKEMKPDIKPSSGSSVKIEPPLSNLYDNKYKNKILNTETTSIKDSSDRDDMSSPVSTAPKNSASRKGVLKELKNISDLDEVTAVNIAIESDDEYGDESDDRWTERPPKKSKYNKETKKRVKSPVNEVARGKIKKRRFMGSVKTRRTIRSSNYHNGDSSEDGSFRQCGSVNDISERRQCFGHKCLKVARPNSNYCSDDCGMNLASLRIVQTLPDRLREWNITQCTADVRSKKELEKIRAEQDAVKSRLEQLNIDFRNLEVISNV